MGSNAAYGLVPAAFQSSGAQSIEAAQRSGQPTPVFLQWIGGGEGLPQAQPVFEFGPPAYTGPLRELTDAEVAQWVPYIHRNESGGGFLSQVKDWVADFGPILALPAAAAGLAATVGTASAAGSVAGSVAPEVLTVSQAASADIALGGLGGSAAADALIAAGYGAAAPAVGLSFGDVIQGARYASTAVQAGGALAKQFGVGAGAVAAPANPGGAAPYQLSINYFPPAAEAAPLTGSFSSRNYLQPGDVAVTAPVPHEAAAETWSTGAQLAAGVAVAIALVIAAKYFRG